MSKCINHMTLRFLALPENEAFARVAVGGFLLPLNPQTEDLSDIRTAVSEAVTNCVLHGYAQKADGEVEVAASYTAEGQVEIRVMDEGCGIEDIEQARTPLFTTRPDMERAGLGFAVMEGFMDEVEVLSAPGKGTTVILRKQL